MLFLLASFGSSSSQDIELVCEFEIFIGEYTCWLSNIEVLNPLANVTVTGEHVEDRNNSDVETVRIRNSTTPFMIQQIFETFPNMMEINIQDSHLESLRIPDSVQLTYVYLNGNNISIIEASSVTGLNNQRQLRDLYLIDCQIGEVDENAFVGLENLTGAVVLIRNQIQEIRPGTLDPLVNAYRIDYERNNLTRIEEATFARNTALERIYLEYNQINEVSRNFLSNNRENLLSINLNGNRCVSQSFFFGSDAEWSFFNNAMQGCYTNFDGSSPDTRRVTMEFVGSIAIYDEFGNILARF